jgi:hypothetical protein
MDDLGMMTDDVLTERLRALETDRDKVVEARFDPKAWEVEACYFRRELQLRRVRHNLHMQYLDELDRELYNAQRYENTLPVADLDNSVFMFVDN